MKIQITPVSVFPHTATQIEFLAAEITLGVSARSQYILQTADGQNLTSAWVSMTPEQYAGWSNDDDYAAAAFIQALGLTPATPINVQLDAAVAERKGAIAAFEADKDRLEAAKAAALVAKAASDQVAADALLAAKQATDALAAKQAAQDELNKPQPEPEDIWIDDLQIRLALNHLGLREAVEGFVASSDQSVKDWYERAKRFFRHNAMVISACDALGVPEDARDALWALGKTL